MLVDAGADVAEETLDGFDAMAIAAERGQNNVCVYLEQLEKDRIEWARANAPTPAQIEAARLPVPKSNINPDFDLESEPVVFVTMRSIRNWYQIERAPSNGLYVESCSVRSNICSVVVAEPVTVTEPVTVAELVTAVEPVTAAEFVTVAEPVTVLDALEHMFASCSMHSTTFEQSSTRRR